MVTCDAFKVFKLHSPAARATLRTLTHTMIKFLPLDFLGVSHRNVWKNENAVYRLQIPILVPEIFKFEKCVNYNDDNLLVTTL